MPEDNAEQQKPVGPFEDHEACVRHFEDDPEVDDPDALCQWMEENAGKTAVQEYQPDEDEVQSLVEAMKDPAASNVLTNLKVTYVSGVENPAQDSQWVMAKDADARGADWGVTAPIVLHAGTQTTTVDGGARAPMWAKDEDDGESEQKKAWAPVLIPNETDKQGDVIPAEAIEKAAHEFLATFRNIDTDHDLLEGKGVPIESWTLKEESTFTLPDGSESREYPKGTWMLGVKFTDEAWKRIKSGELSGFSIYGEAQEHPVEELLGGGNGISLSGTGVAFQATAKEADAATETMNELPEDIEKQLGADELAALAEALRDYFDDAGGEVETISLQEFFEWAVGAPTGELDDTVEIGGVEIPIRPEGEGDGEDDEDEAPEETEEQSMSENPDEEQENSEKNENEGEQPEGEQPGLQEKMDDVLSTVKSTQKSVEDHGERLEALEAEVFEKDTEGEGEEAEGEQPSGDEVKEQATEAATEAAEKQVKDLLGLEDLPEDPDERREVVRKHLHEQPENEGAGRPDEWSEDEVSEVIH